MTSIKIPMSVREIGDEAFKDCIGLTSVEIPTSVEENEYGRKDCFIGRGAGSGT